MKYQNMQQSKFRLPVTATDATSGNGNSPPEMVRLIVMYNHRQAFVVVSNAFCVVFHSLAKF